MLAGKERASAKRSKQTAVNFQPFIEKSVQNRREIRQKKGIYLNCLQLFSLKQERDPVLDGSLNILLPMHIFSSVRQLISQIGGMNYAYQL